MAWVGRMRCLDFQGAPASSGCPLFVVPLAPPWHCSLCTTLTLPRKAKTYPRTRRSHRRAFPLTSPVRRMVHVVSPSRFVCSQHFTPPPNSHRFQEHVNHFPPGRLWSRRLHHTTDTTSEGDWSRSWSTLAASATGTRSEAVLD